MTQSDDQSQHVPGARIMLIDDEKMDQMMYRRVLNRSGYATAVDSFATALDALDYLRDPANTRPDIIFLDINMPRMDGFQFLDAAISEFGADFTKAIVIMLTTSLNRADKERAAQYEVVKEFVNKPLSSSLLKRLSPYFENRSAAT